MSTALLELRPYQREAIHAVIAARRSGVRRMLVHLPTGAGKTVIFSHLARLARKQVLVLAHREELLSQARDKIQRALGPSGSAEVVAIERGNESAPRAARILVCSIRSLHEARLAHVVNGRDIGLVIYDECHHAAADDNLRVLTQLGVFQPSFEGTLLGFTATTERGDGKGLERVFEKIVYSKSLREMIEAGYLAPLRGLRIATEADLTRLTSGGADFDEDELAEAVDIEERNALVARTIQELARDRRTIAFCVNVNHARNLARSLRVLGVSAAVVHGVMPSEERARVLADFRLGRFSVLTNVGVLTEGFDDPEVSCIAMARPTRSSGLYTQCVGRGTRLFSEKKNCLILDFVDVSSLELCTLPSLFGLPRDFDLRGDDVVAAARAWERIEFDHPGFVVEAGAVTLAEIQERAAHFDPLGLPIDPEVRAISGNAWFSLGSRGVGVHFEERPGVVCEVLVLDALGRGKRWQVSFDGVEQARFSRLEDAVEAVDYEIAERGWACALSARAEAPWRAFPERSKALQQEVFQRILRKEPRKTPV